MNAALGNVGKTVLLHRSGRSESGGSTGVAAGPGEGPGRGRGRAAADPGRQSGLQRRRSSSGCGTASRRRRCASTSACIADETSAVCQWHLPETHYLETWGDARAFDGTVTIQQPLIQPLYGGRSASQVLQMLTETAGAERARHRERLLGDAAQGRGFRSLVAARGSRRRGRGDGAAGHDARRTMRGAALATPARPRAARRQAGSDLPARSRRSMTAGSPTTAGFRSCRSRSPS